MKHSAPHYINEHQSDMRGIKDGWYAIEKDGNLGQCYKPRRSVEFAIGKQSGVGRDHGSTKLNREPAVEIKPENFGSPVRCIEVWYDPDVVSLTKLELE